MFDGFKWKFEIRVLSLENIRNLILKDHLHEDVPKKKVHSIKWDRKGKSFKFLESSDK